jgi:hypothetical protein
MTKINSQLFTYHISRETVVPHGKFCCEMSTLQANGLDPLKLVWHDAETQGFVMVSENTGDEVLFVLLRRERDADGDIRSWIFKASWGDIQRHPNLDRVSVVVFNT